MMLLIVIRMEILRHFGSVPGRGRYMHFFFLNKSKYTHSGAKLGNSSEDPFRGKAGRITRSKWFLIGRLNLTHENDVKATATD